MSMIKFHYIIITLFFLTLSWEDGIQNPLTPKLTTNTENIDISLLLDGSDYTEENIEISNSEGNDLILFEVILE